MATKKVKVENKNWKHNYKAKVTTNSTKTPTYKKVKCESTGREMLEIDGYTDDIAEMNLKAEGVALANYVDINDQNEMVAKSNITDITREEQEQYLDISHISKNKIENFNAVQRGQEMKAEADYKAKEFKKWQLREAKKKEKEVPTKEEKPTKVEQTGGDK